MAKEIEVVGVVERVLRTNGKPTKMVVSVAPESAAAIPLGNVQMRIMPVQGELELGGGKMRGDRG